MAVDKTDGRRICFEVDFLPAKIDADFLDQGKGCIPGLSPVATVSSSRSSPAATTSPLGID